MSVNYSSMGTLGQVTGNTNAKAREVLHALFLAQGKNLKTLWGKGGPPEHSTGRAIDFMVPGDFKAGDFIADYVIRHRARLGLGWVIWKQHIWAVGRDGFRADGTPIWRWMQDRGSWTQNHMDHPHVYFASDGYSPPSGGSSPATKPTPKPSSTSTPSVGRPAPGPRHGFPMPKGYFFGENDGTDYSVSGRFRRSFAGQDATFWIAEFVAQLGRRGWNISKGGPYLTKGGNDGIAGAEFTRLVKAFQRDQWLQADGKVGYETWWVAFFRDVT